MPSVVKEARGRRSSQVEVDWAGATPPGPQAEALLRSIDLLSRRLPLRYTVEVERRLYRWLPCIAVRLIATASCSQVEIAWRRSRVLARIPITTRGRHSCWARVALRLVGSPREVARKLRSRQAAVLSNLSLEIADEPTDVGSSGGSGIVCGDLAPGSTFEIFTENRSYEGRVLAVSSGSRTERYLMLRGHPTYCPNFVRAHIQGSTNGKGTALWAGRIVPGMRLEFAVRAGAGVRSVTTSEIIDVNVRSPAPRRRLGIRRRRRASRP